MIISNNTLEMNRALELHTSRADQVLRFLHTRQMGRFFSAVTTVLHEGTLTPSLEQKYIEIN